jgi:hypothetical protein
MAQFFNVQIVNVETNEIYSNNVHFAKDYAPCKQIPRNCIVDGNVSNSLQLTLGKGQSYAYFAHPAAEKGKVFYIKLDPQEFVNLNSRKFELHAQISVPNVGKLETPKGFYTRMNAEAIAEAELTQETVLPASVIAELGEDGKLTQESVNSIVDEIEPAAKRNKNRNKQNA